MIFLQGLYEWVAASLESSVNHFPLIQLVFNSVIQRNVKLSEAPSYGVPTILYDAESTGAKNHLALAKEIINRNK